MDKLRSAVLTITFLPDPVDFAIVTAFTIPEKKAYQSSIENLGDMSQYGNSFEEQQKVFQDKVLREVKILERSPDNDYDKTPIAPIDRIFSQGFYGTNWNSFFYAGMGHSGFFLGVVECRFEGDKMIVKRKVEA